MLRGICRNAAASCIGKNAEASSSRLQVAATRRASGWAGSQLRRGKELRSYRRRPDAQCSFSGHIACPSLTRRFSATPSANAKGKQREETSEDGSGLAEEDDAVGLLQALMAKRDLLIAQRAREAAGSPTIAKELADLESLHELWRAWQQQQKTITSLLQMTTPEAEPDEDMRALAVEEAEATLQEVETLKERIRRALMPVEDLDAQDAIIEVRMGVGGGESSLFVGNIARMYTKFCEKAVIGGDGTTPSFDVEELSSSPVEVSAGNAEGFREVILTIKGEGAYGLMRHEAGVHRVQRIPVTQNTGKIQTSTIAVIVLPAGGRDGSRDAETIKDDVVDPKDVKLEVMRSRGAGGQHVNKTESAVRLTHEPTGITVSMQDSRSQHQNRTKAWTILRARLLDRKLRVEQQENRETRRSQIGTMERHERIRTYNWPQDRVTDHRIPLTVKGLDAVMEGLDASAGGLGYIIEELLEHRNGLALIDRKEQVEQEVAAMKEAAAST